MLNSGVYIIFNKVNCKTYVGSATNFSKRWAVHRHGLKRGKHENIILQRAWAKYGAEAFEFIVIERVELDKLLEREQYWMDTLQVCEHGYNILPIAGSGIGHQVSAETRAKISASHKGVKLSPEHCAAISKVQTGRVPTEAALIQLAEARTKIKYAPRTPETKAKIGAANRGQKRSEEVKRQLSIAHTGIKHSDEARARMSKAQKGRTFTDETKAKMSEAAKRRPPRPPISDEVRQHMREAQQKRAREQKIIKATLAVGLPTDEAK